MLLGKKLTLYRTNKKLTQQDIADYLKITRQGYSNYERGTREPDIDVLVALSRFYKISIDEMLDVDIKQTNNLLTEDEKNFLINYALLNEKSKKFLEATMKNELEHEAEKKALQEKLDGLQKINEVELKIEVERDFEEEKKSHQQKILEDLSKSIDEVKNKGHSDEIYIKAAHGFNSETDIEAMENDFKLLDD